MFDKLNAIRDEIVNDINEFEQAFDIDGKVAAYKEQLVAEKDAAVADKELELKAVDRIISRLAPESNEVELQESKLQL